MEEPDILFALNYRIEAALVADIKALAIKLGIEHRERELLAFEWGAL